MKGYLLLANGQLYEGTLMGAAKPVMAELVFTTAMTGYLETLTVLRRGNRHSDVPDHWQLRRDSGGLRVAAPAPVRIYRP